ncbi:MAG: MAPEG family protein [Pseudomonadales bacterium]
MSAPLLAPAAVLVAWSLIMLFWMAGTRFPAMSRSGIDLGTAQPGGRGQDLENVLPPQVNWKSHNYTHLMEQPTLFYATIMILVLAEAGDGINLLLAWGYVLLRIAHSLWQSLVNSVPVRFALFLLSTLCLTGLAINALRATINF